MFTAENINQSKKDSGSALVIALIVLVILAALGYAGLEVADLNIFSSANDRDNKAAFLHADSGANVGHEILEQVIDNARAEDYAFFSGQASIWKDQPYDPLAINGTEFRHIYAHGTIGTHIRSGWLYNEPIAGEEMQEGKQYSGLRPGVSHVYLIRSHREGERNSHAEADIAWRHVAR